MCAFIFCVHNVRNISEDIDKILYGLFHINNHQSIFKVTKENKTQDRKQAIRSIHHLPFFFKLTDILMNRIIPIFLLQNNDRGLDKFYHKHESAKCHLMLFMSMKNEYEH